MFKNKRLYLIGLAAGLIFLLGIYFMLCSLASQKVNFIFADAMSKQKVLRGTISTQEIRADIWGRVYFKNLTWLDPQGEPVVFVPQGMFKVSTWDIITKQVDINTLKELVLENALFSLDFNEKMQLDVVRYQKKKSAHRKKVNSKNLNLQEKIPALHLELHNCTLSAQYKQRYFALYAVNLLLDSSDKNKLMIDLSAGPFGGNLVGESIMLKGTVNNIKQPKLNHSLAMEKVLPEAMGLRNVKDLATVTGQVKGTWQEPQVDGTISFEALNIPALHFNNVKGNYHYENGIINFTDVSAGLYGGYVNAEGKYYLDSRDYQLHAVGREMLASLAARSSKINCKVDMDLHMDADGKTKKVHTYGNFTTGRGSYLFVPFEKIQGEFSDRNKELSFSNVIIHTFLGDIGTDAFQIIDGKLSIENLSLTGNNGEKVELDISNK